MHARTTSDLARAFWRERPLMYAVTIFLGVLGIFALGHDVAALFETEPADALMRYSTAGIGAVVAYRQATGWRADALDRARRVYEAAGP